jgi:uncharacterized repeat protein (TIGR03843 family)
LTDAAEALARGDLELRGRILPASNAAFLADAVLDEVQVACIYKPVAGERPLWDFPDGTLAARERAAYLVSDALGWDVVPLTLLREGPHGVGMVQQWQEPADPRPGVPDPIDLCPRGRVPAGFLHVLDAEDGAGNDVSLVHEDSAPLRRMAVFDVLVNNADRKGGHVLAMSDGHRFGVDHGVCFHVETKLRTVLWGWAGRPLEDDLLGDVRRLLTALREPSGARTDGAPTLTDELAGLLTAPEVLALERRAERLLRAGSLPVPGRGWPSIPWPAF